LRDHGFEDCDHSWRILALRNDFSLVLAVVPGDRPPKIARDKPAGAAHAQARTPDKDDAMADVNRGNRPLSPHMTIYRWPITAITSILTRITGNAMIVSAALIVWWFAAAAAGPESFATADGFLRSWFGDLVMFFSVLGLWYHTLAGIRHLIWDEVKLLEIDKAELLSQIILIVSVLLTIFTVVVL
jgi:succinate dehydrogenase / fumarate reductase cytochrome b subunit